jgi:nucleotide-binding universal stress UspA family protein
MFKCILVPIDNGDVPGPVMAASIDLALRLNAAITGFVVEPLPPIPLHPLAADRQALVAQRHQERAAAHADELLAPFERLALDAGVVFHRCYDSATHHDRQILDAVAASGCDVIVMASQGRGAFGEFLFGSQAKAVLAGCSLPLLVLKPAAL